MALFDNYNRPQPVLRPGQDTSTVALVIGTYKSHCSSCDANAIWSVGFTGSCKGCGKTFTHRTSDYVGEGVENWGAVTGLPWIEYALVPTEWWDVNE